MLITFALFTYNQEQFVAQAVQAALSQTYQPLEIIISDDCSSDGTFEIIQQEISGYTGPHQIRVNRNARNIGFGAHINLVSEMARGQLIVAAAGDDISLPTRVETLFRAYESSNCKALSIFSNATVIDERGAAERLYLNSVRNEHLSVEWMADHLSGALGCAHAWDRRLFEFFGPINEHILQEDVAIPFRAVLLGDCRFVDEPLVLYRRHSNNLHFKHPRDIKASAHLYSYLLSLADGRIAIYEDRLRDLDVFLQLHPEHRCKVEGLRKVTIRRRREMTDERALLLQRSLRRRATIIVRAIWRGTPPRRIVRWILTSFFPMFYLSWLARLQAPKET